MHRAPEVPNWFAGGHRLALMTWQRELWKRDSMSSQNAVLGTVGYIVGSWTLGHLDTWTLGQMDTWTLGHLHIAAHGLLIVFPSTGNFLVRGL